MRKEMKRLVSGLLAIAMVLTLSGVNTKKTSAGRYNVCKTLIPADVTDLRGQKAKFWN